MAISVPGFKVLKENERGALFRLGRIIRVAGPGLVLHYPIVDLVVVVNLDRTIPGWRGIPENHLKEYVEFLALKYPQIPMNLSVSDIHLEMSHKREQGKLTKELVNKEEAIKKNLEGLKLYQDGNYEEALKLFNEALEIDSELASARLNRSDVYRKLGKEAEADADSEKWESLQPTHTEGAQQSGEISLWRLLITDVPPLEYGEMRGQFCKELRNMGINAQLSEPLRVFEDINRGSYSESLGMIEITECPIHWVNIIQIKNSTTVIGTVIGYQVKFGISDSKLCSDYPDVKIQSKRKGDIWQWKGKDSGQGIIERLNNDRLTNTWLASMKRPEISIRSYSKWRFWVISSYIQENMPVMISEESWNCYKNIANHLLS